jgi:gliding motility-associated-like protein
MKLKLLLFLLILHSLSLFATHNRAGEITYQYLNGLTYQFTIITYTYTPSPADRPQIEVYWGDGTSSIINRNSKTDLGNDISKNIYITNHSYSSMGTYHVTFEDPNRNAGIVNIPNSVNIPFFIDNLVIINPFLGMNSSPVLLNPPIDNGCVNVPFYHNPGAYDAEGDSLSFKLIRCKGFNGDDIPGFTFPSASQSFTIDAYTGELTWDSPQIVGEYNIAIQINEYRNHILIGTMVRDMQVSIAACNNQPPEIQTITDTCVTAGEQLKFDVIVTDPNSSQVTLTATGAPFLLTDSPAFLQSTSGTPPITSSFVWNTECSHVKKGKYIVNLKAMDNGPIINLVSFKTIYITVVAPKPENPIAISNGNSIKISWDRERCSNAVGYKIYKRTDSFSFDPDICETGLPGYTGYRLLGINYSHTDTSFTDDGTLIPLYHANWYCYRIVAYFADGAESYVSDEVCAYIVNDAPLITNVDVDSTDLFNGRIIVKWLAPPEIDTTLVVEPYFFKLYRASSENSIYTELTTINFDQDYSVIDQNLNTENVTYYYKVEFWGEGDFGPFMVETSDQASSVFLETKPTDNALILNWNPRVPWQNRSFDIYRFNDLSNQFDSIATTSNLTYTDYSLQNGVEYCYYVKSVGGYLAPDTLYPFYNRSQVKCASPIDNVPPQIPEISITTDCEKVLISWTFDNDTAFIDVFKYYIYYRPNYQSNYYLLDSVMGSGEPCFPNVCEKILSDRPHITGCYTLALIDSMGNITEKIPEVCFDVEDCMTYTLPNVFTPNKDGINDLWIPFPYANVDTIDLYVYNRWGRKVFHTNNPDINWDGVDYLSGEPVSDGTYYYSCEIIIETLNGPKTIDLHGTVTLLTNANR